MRVTRGLECTADHNNAKPLYIMSIDGSNGLDAGSTDSRPVLRTTQRPAASAIAPMMKGPTIRAIPPITTGLLSFSASLKSSAQAAQAW